MFRLLLRCVLIACLAMLAGCPKSASKGTALDEIQYTWSAAIRWGDFEGAWGLVDPKVREAHPMTDLDFSRFKQVQISTYRERWRYDEAAKTWWLTSGMPDLWQGE